MEVFDSEQMRRADRHAIDVARIPGSVLMENAGRLVAEVVASRVGDDARIVILAGPGNNGGDGFVAARHLAGSAPAAALVETVLVGARVDDLRGDAAQAAHAWVASGGPLIEIPDLDAWESSAPALTTADVVIDALFGTGLSRPLTGLPAAVVGAIDEASAHGAVVVAVDLPSGLDASRAEPPGPVPTADLTVTFARPKLAHLLPPAEDFCGEVVVVDIGLPDEALDAAGCRLHWSTAEEMERLLPTRAEAAHKGTFGHVLAVAGSRGKSGAATLVGLGSLRCGAGLVTVASVDPARCEVATAVPELMTVSLPGDDAGRITEGAAAVALELAASRTVLALGPGLGRSASLDREVHEIVSRSPVPVVLDADGLNAFDEGGCDRLAARAAPLVVTPHPGEAGRLLGTGTKEIQKDRIASAREIARRADAVCVLKGYRSLIAEPGGTVWINPTGNPGMASAGMGDLLTGMIAALVAGGLEPFDAARLGVFLHGLAADVAVAGERTEETLIATDLLETLPDAFRVVRGAVEPDGADRPE